MPFWNFFAFDSNSAAQNILQPVQDAIRARDLSLWQKVFAQLYAKHSPQSWIIGQPDLALDWIPEESNFILRRTLQNEVERMAAESLEGRFPRARHWVCNEVSWPKILKSSAERDEIEAFKEHIIKRQKKAPDPFWCLESNDYVDSNYAAPDVVKRMAETESKVGLFRALAQRHDPGSEIEQLAQEIARAGVLIDRAANRGLAIYFREDGT